MRTEKLANTKEVGDALEILVEAHLHLDQVLKAKNVWVVGDIPLKIRKSLNLPADSKGIDGVYEDASGHIIPYQVKYRTDKETLPYGEVSSFLGITEESLKDRVIFTNARNLAADITKRKGLRSFKAAQFHSLTEEDFNRIHAWLSDKKPAFKRWSPQTHQKEAIEKITAALKETDRTTAVMACGTGKTLVALWAAEAQKPKTVLVLVPSLALLSQTLPDWCKQTSWGERFRYLCVCSDASVDRSAKEDEYALKQSDLEFSVTTDAKVVKDFVSDNQSGVNVIFSTYQSAEVVAEGTKGKTIDLGIFDEAHKTTGPKEGLFAFGLNDKNLRIKKRVFLTATPRHYNLNKRDKNGDFQTVSMSEESVYGQVSYRLSFSAAVAAGIIVPYKVIISVSLNKEVDAELLRRGSTLVRRDQIQAKWVANQIALKRAIEKTGASKIITFHSRVNLAEDFAGDDSRGFKEHVKGFDVFHVNGSQNAADRKALLEGFKTAPRGLITNARCLTEGVDVPAVDMVAFVDPRKSKIDIAQAAGRAMRQSKATNKKLGYIVVPLFIEQKKGETESEALTRSGFDEVALVLGAMLESDDDLVDTVKEMQEARGRGDKFNPKLLREKIEVIGPAVDLGELTRSIDVEILDRLGPSWYRWYGLLQKFHKQTGHSRVAVDDILDGLRIGIWVNNQRQNKDKLSQEQLRLLELLDFSWDPLTEKWEENYQALRSFVSSSGNRYVVQGTVFKGHSLGSWVNAQRIKKRKGLLTLEQIKKLDSIHFSWEPISDQWNEAFNALRTFKKKTGHCRITKKQDSDYPNLGIWVQVQRTHKSRLTIEQINQLDSIGFSWDPSTERWEEAFEALNEFRKKEGHCRVARGQVVGGIELGNWVSEQRKRLNSNLMPKPQLERLKSIGFSWDPSTERWDEAFSELVKFHRTNGHCNVPQLAVHNNCNLGIWVSNQRKNKARLSPDQARRLEALNFCWDPLSQIWEEAFTELAKFRKREGHCKVPARLVVNNIGLGMWVSRQRKKRDQLTKDQFKRLDSLGFSWDPLAEQWDEAFTELAKFRKREGHCKVAAKFSVGTLKLGVWVSMQRQNRKQLAQERIVKLDSLGFCWDPLSVQWDEAFADLAKFRKRAGHCKVSKSYSSNGINLGEWIIRQRGIRDQLTPERIKRLNSLGFIWKP